MSRTVATLPAALRVKADRFVSEHVHLMLDWRDLDAKRGEYELRVRGSEDGGFDIAAEIRTYGIYPLVDERPLGWSWDTASPLSIEQICDQFLSLVRATLSRDCRIRRKLLAGQVCDSVIEAASPQGWQVVDGLSLGFFRRWRLRNRRDIDEGILQNEVLPPVGFAVGLETWDNFVFRRHVR